MRVRIQAAAEADILQQIEHYAELGLLDVAIRFRAAVLTAIDAVIARPLAGSPRLLRNPRLAGLRRWPVRGFRAFWIFYLAEPEQITILRVLHDRRDTGAIMAQEPEAPR